MVRIILFLLIFCNCSRLIIMRDCCMDSESCSEMKSIEDGKAYAVDHVKGDGCDKKVFLREK